MQRAQGDRWNHNIHYHRLVFDAVPSHAATALDVGTGDGLLAMGLRGIVSRVTGIDTDEQVLGRAARAEPHVEWVHGDVLSYEFGHRFDVVASIATVHHMPDLPGALTRLHDLVAPGGVLVVIGLARATNFSERMRHLLGVIHHQWYSRTRGFWEHSAPKVPDLEHSYAEVRQIANDVLPGMQWRQLPLWRYAIIWRRSPAECGSFDDPRGDESSD